jgi:hypothetical protein
LDLFGDRLFALFQKNPTRWRWIALGSLLLLEFALLDHFISRHHAWVYPRWNDQIQYLTEAYTGHEHARVHGFWAGLWQTLINPSAQGTLHDFFAVIIFAVAGPSRSAALSLNLGYLVAWQAALFFAIIKTTRSPTLGFASVGLLLALNSPWWGGPGSVVDFRLDWPACGAFGLALALAVCTEGFRSTRWSLAFGAAVGLTLLTRFLTGAYFIPIFFVLLVGCLVRPQRWVRSGNLILAALVAFALAGPVFWLNRDWVYNYYLIGHFTGPESAIRSPNMGLTRSAVWVWQNWWGLHVGVRCAWLVLAATVAFALLALRGRFVKRTGETGVRVDSGDWMFPGLAFLLAPAAVLILHSQKSELVLSILLPGAVLLVVGLWGALLRFNADSKIGGVIAAAVVLAGGWLALSTLANPGRPPEFNASTRKVNELADYIYKTQRAAGLANPRIGVDQVTDSLDGQIMRVLCYERHKAWVPFIMTLPTGIMEEKPEVIMERLAQSDFMFLTDQMHGDGHWPYDKLMRRQYPQLKKWCEEHLQVVTTFSLYDRQMTLYQRRDLPPALQ